VDVMIEESTEIVQPARVLGRLARGTGTGSG
jgi:hypothetical protein